MTKDQFLVLMDKVIEGVASAFDGTPEAQMEALDLLGELRERADGVLELLRDEG